MYTSYIVPGYKKKNTEKKRITTFIGDRDSCWSLLVLLLSACGSGQLSISLSLSLALWLSLSPPGSAD